MAFPEGPNRIYYLGRDYHVRVALHASEVLAREALEILRDNPAGTVYYTVENDGDMVIKEDQSHDSHNVVEGSITYRSHDGADFLRFIHDSTILYFSQNEDALKGLSGYLKSIPETPAFTIQGLQQFAFENDYPTDFFVSPTSTVGGRSKRTRKSKRSKRTKRSKRARRTLRKK